MSIKYRKFEPNQYVIKVKRGQIKEKGLGLSFFYNTRTTSMMVVPAVAIDTGFTFADIMTSDYQGIYVQGDISFAIEDYEKAAQMVDFTFRSEKEYEQVLFDAKEKISNKVINAAKVSVVQLICNKDVREAISISRELEKILFEDLQENGMLKKYGLTILGVSILSVLPGKDTKHALESTTREQILKEQDDAIYKRRNACIEQERVIRENELQTEISIAEKEKEKKEKEMDTRRLIQEHEAEILQKEIQNSIAIEEEKIKLTDLEVENAKRTSDSKAYDLRVQLEVYKEMDPAVLEILAMNGMDSKKVIAKAFMGLGERAERIGNLNVSPELLSSLLR